MITSVYHSKIVCKLLDKDVENKNFNKVFIYFVINVLKPMKLIIVLMFDRIPELIATKNLCFKNILDIFEVVHNSQRSIQNGKLTENNFEERSEFVVRVLNMYTI